ncbi:putative disease resistance protein RGA4 [Triticum dicoccoides]|uniref:putative disease resistance protein RGA4 n=1 Tax=Triticum dicoccoides TaxID=85692 RepID=UPI00188F0ADF|nr:putative disease resistance protein RGA4 [Triticum dicoccoides]
MLELIIIGAEIAQQPKGLPLAASTVGGHLRKRQSDVDFWREVRDCDLLNETTGALWWSYQHLDEQVRRCFVYCSIFPKRYGLNQDELVKLWVAEGFIQTTNAEEDMEAIGQHYFHELLATSFVHDENSFVQLGGYYQGSLCYLVHDLMHDLAENATGSDCFRTENGSRREVPHDVRHLFVANGRIVTEEFFKLKNLRTLVIDYMELAPANKEFFEKVFEKLQKLRVLTIETSWTLHLQELMFGYASDVDVSSDINMGNLTNLRHIIGGEIAMHIPNIGRLISLQTIETFDVRREHGYESKQLRDLNKLRGGLTIQNLENVESKKEAHEAKLADKKGLTELRLFWVNDRACTPEVQAEVLEGLCPPKDLKSLEVWRYPSWMVGEQNGGPKHLNELIFHDCSRLRPAPELFEHLIHLLHLLIAECCWDHLTDNVKDLRFLKSLTIRLCWYLESLPELPRSLQKFKVSYCNGEYMSSCKQIGHLNLQKLQHVEAKEFVH